MALYYFNSAEKVKMTMNAFYGRLILSKEIRRLRRLILNQNAQTK